MIRVITDNGAIVAVINKLYSKDATLRNLLRPITLLCLDINVQVIARHVPGQDNVVPDLLSRGRIQEFKAKFPYMAEQPSVIPVCHLLPGSCGLF